jgi:predicted DNA-binding transcriptional regulator AlpA
MQKIIDENEDKRKLFDKQIWTIHDVATFLQKSEAHVYRLKRERNLPYRKNGTLYFYPQEVVEWLEQGA